MTSLALILFHIKLMEFHFKKGLKHPSYTTNENIEIVNNYTYLGMKFFANGNFTNHKENLTEKTKRSFFAARCYVDFLKLPIQIIIKLFNRLFFLTLTYCSKVWGIYDKSELNVNVA